MTKDFVPNGSGSDTFVASLGDVNHLFNGGAGNDVASFTNATLGLTVDMVSGTVRDASASNQIGIDSLIGIETVWCDDSEAASRALGFVGVGR